MYLRRRLGDLAPVKRVGVVLESDVGLEADVLFESLATTGAQ